MIQEDTGRRTGNDLNENASGDTFSFPEKLIAGPVADKQAEWDISCCSIICTMSLSSEPVVCSVNQSSLTHFRIDNEPIVKLVYLNKTIFLSENMWVKVAYIGATIIDGLNREIFAK